MEDAENSAVLDNLLEKLRAGDNIGRKGRRTRPSASSRPSGPLTLNTEDVLAGGNTGNDTADLALNMLAQLKSNGFDAITPSSPTSSSTPRRPRRRRPSTSAFRGIAEELEGSPMLQESSLTEGEFSPRSTREMSISESASEAEESNSTIHAPTTENGTDEAQ